MIRNAVLVYPAQRRYCGFLSTHRLPGLATAHSGLTILAQLLALANHPGHRARAFAGSPGGLKGIEQARQRRLSRVEI